MSPRVVGSLLFAALVSSSIGAWPGPAPKATIARHVVGGPTSGLTAPPFGRSLGSPTEGRLIGGVHLQESACLRVCPTYSNTDVRWGLEHLVGLLDRAARGVRRQYPDAVLSVGHLSRSGGGEIDHHASHESGRDADVGFYIRSASGKPLNAEHFIAFRGDATAPTWPGAVFDDARNWAFVAALLTDPKVRVAHIFVASPLRARLLAHADRIGAPHVTRLRAAEIMAQPRGALPHDDHFHVRIGCPPGMSGCIEYPTSARVRHGGRAGSPSRALRDRGRAPAVAPGATKAVAMPPLPPASARPAHAKPEPRARAPVTPSPPPPPHAEPPPDDPRSSEAEDAGDVEAPPPAVDVAPAPLDDVDGPLD